MGNNIFDFFDYRDYLKNWIGDKPNKGRGQRAALASAMGSPISHISQVLSGVSQLNCEQAENANQYLGHTSIEAEYFLLLVLLGRAGTPLLKKRIRTQVDRIRQQQLVLKDRLGVKHSIRNEDQLRFYSSWHFAAIHILLTVEGFQTRDKIAQYFSLSPARTSEILDFLVKLGLVEQKDGRYRVGTERIHLGIDSALLNRHHMNWRLQSIRSLEQESSFDDLHYSSVVSLSENDVSEVKSLLVKSIERTKALIKESPAEKLYSFCLDFFIVK